MEKIAIISDIHGNLEALKTVLQDIAKRKIDHIFCLGDTVAKGTHMHECLELVRKNCEVVIQGNCDYAYSLPIPKEKWDTRYRWNRQKLTEDDIAYLRSLPFSYEFYLSGRLVRIFHATPSNIQGTVGNIDSLENLYNLFLPSDKTPSQEKADLVLYGHLHTAFLQKIYNRTIINVGSVGNSLDIFRNIEKDGKATNTTVANYVILTGEYGSKDNNSSLSYEFVNIPYAIENELSKNNDNIEKESYASELRNGCYRDQNKIANYFKDRGIDSTKI